MDNVLEGRIVTLPYLRARKFVKNLALPGSIDSHYKNQCISKRSHSSSWIASSLCKEQSGKPVDQPRVHSDLHPLISLTSGSTEPCVSCSFDFSACLSKTTKDLPFNLQRYESIFDRSPLGPQEDVSTSNSSANRKRIYRGNSSRCDAIGSVLSYVGGNSKNGQTMDRKSYPIVLDEACLSTRGIVHRSGSSDGKVSKIIR